MLGILRVSNENVRVSFWNISEVVGFQKNFFKSTYSFYAQVSYTQTLQRVVNKTRTLSTRNVRHIDSKISFFDSTTNLRLILVLCHIDTNFDLFLEKKFGPSKTFSVRFFLEVGTISISVS